MSYEFSDRVSKVDTSGIRKVFDLAASMKDPINLSIGQPDFAVPESIREAACDAIRFNKNGYSQTQGIAILRDKIRSQYKIDESRDVLLTSGVSGGIFLSYLSIFDPGDEILIPDPFFCAYRDIAYLVNAIPVYYNTYPDFSLKLEILEGLITPKTKAILVNSPSNPTGYVMAEEEIINLVKFAARHNLWLISDEIYSRFCYDAEHITLEGMYDKLILLNGYSKSFAVTGWRIGFAIAPKSFIAQMQKAQQYTYVCAPTPFQWAITLADITEEQSHVDEYRAKRDLMCDLLKDIVSFKRPGGAFYLFAKVPCLQKSLCTGEQFVESCIANGLLIVPGTAFSSKNSHFRISFAAPECDLRQGAKIIEKVARA